MDKTTFYLKHLLFATLGAVATYHIIDSEEEKSIKSTKNFMILGMLLFTSIVGVVRLLKSRIVKFALTSVSLAAVCYFKHHFYWSTMVWVYLIVMY